MTNAQKKIVLGWLTIPFVLGGIGLATEYAMKQGESGRWYLFGAMMLMSLFFRSRSDIEFDYATNSQRIVSAVESNILVKMYMVLYVLALAAAIYSSLSKGEPLVDTDGPHSFFKMLFLILGLYLPAGVIIQLERYRSAGKEI